MDRHQFGRQAERQTDRPRYSVFFFDLRRELGLSANEYLVADVVAHLSTDKSRIPGWCYASRGYLAKTVGVSRRSVQSLVARLGSRGIIERHPTQPALLRTTETWRLAARRMRAKMS